MPNVRNSAACNVYHNALASAMMSTSSCFTVSDWHLRSVFISLNSCAAADAHRARETQYDWTRGVCSGLFQGNWYWGMESNARCLLSFVFVQVNCPSYIIWSLLFQCCANDLKRTNNLESYVQWFNRLSYFIATEICMVSIHPSPRTPRSLPNLLHADLCSSLAALEKEESGPHDWVLHWCGKRMCEYWKFQFTDGHHWWV